MEQMADKGASAVVLERHRDKDQCMNLASRGKLQK